MRQTGFQTRQECLDTEDKTNTWRPFATGNCLPFKSLHLTSWTNRVLSNAINSLFYSCKKAKIVFFKVLIGILKNAFYLKTYSRNHLEIFRNYKGPKGTKMSDWGMLRNSMWKAVLKRVIPIYPIPTPFTCFPSKASYWICESPFWQAHFDHLWLSDKAVSYDHKNKQTKIQKKKNKQTTN